MGTSDRSKIAELMGRAESLDAGPTKVAVLEEATRLADLLADVPLGYEARTKLIETAIFTGSPEKALVAFSWCLAQYDRDPSSFEEWTILWEYKWIVDQLASHPRISRAQIAAALEDFALRVDRAGYGPNPVLKLRFRVAEDLGDVEEAEKSFELWQKSPRVALSDCAACDLNAEIGYLASSGRDEEALERARPILNGSMKCRVVPHSTLPKLFLPLVRLGRVAEAVPLHLKGYRLIARNRRFLGRTGEHIRFLALTDNLAKGIRLFETHLPWALETGDPLERFLFAAYSTLLFDRLRASDRNAIRLRLPRSFPGFNESGRYEAADVGAWLVSDATELARRFDERNGNDAFMLKIEESRRLDAIVTPFPVSVPRKGRAPGQKSKEADGDD